MDEKTVSTSIAPFETCPAADVIAKDLVQDVCVSNREESVITVYPED